MVKGQHQFLQGYNAQAAINEQQIVIAAEIEVVSPDFGHLECTLGAARRELQQVAISELPKTVVADSGYWHTEQMQRLAAEGIPSSSAPTPACEAHPDRAGTAASMTSCDEYWPPNTARRSTDNASI